MGFSTQANLEPKSITVTAAESLIGVEIECGNLDVLTLFIDYTKGDETGLSIIPYSMYENGGDGFQLQKWSTSGVVQSSSGTTFSLTASGKYQIVFDISGIEWCKFNMQALGGTPNGTIKAFYVVAEI